MDEDRRIYVAVALIAAVAVGSLFVGRGGKPNARASSDGGGWRSRLSAFGLVTPAPDPASQTAASSSSPSPAPAGLSAPEPMMTKAATRLFSSPSSGTGGIAGSEPPASPEPGASASATPRVNLVDSSPNMPGGGSAPTSGGLGIGGGAGGRSASAGAPQGRGGAPGFAGGAGGAGPAARGTGPGAAGDATAAGKAAQAFNGSTDSKLGFKGGAPGGPVAGGTPGALSGNRSAAGGPPGGADSKAPGLPDVAAGVALPKDKSAGSAAAAGGGGGASGGGGGASGGAGMSGGPPAANAKTDGAGGPSGGAPVPSGGPSVSGGPDAPVEATPALQPFIGVPRVGTTTANGGMFRLTPNGPAIIPTFVNTTDNGRKIVGFTAKLAIDADGAGTAYRSDRAGQNRTALQYRDGSSLNPATMPYIVVPTDFGNTHPNVQLGDYATVTYGAKSIFAIVGDKGPPGVLGEGSIAVARAFGINSDPNRGGSQRPEFGYRIVAGSRDPEPPRDAAKVQARGRDVFESAGAPVR